MAHSVSRSHMIYTIAVIGFIFVLHTAIPVYSNSSFLSLFASEKIVGFIYMAGAVMSILGFLLAPFLVRKYGNYHTIVGLIILQVIAFYLLISESNPDVLILAFIVQTGIASVISFCIDIFLESYTDGHHIGRIRGFYTATLSASWVIAPLIGTMLIGEMNNYRNTYVAALAMLFPLLYIVFKNFSHYHDAKYTHSSPWDVIKHIFKNKDWIRLFTINSVLQVFYAWMVVYSPIYLHRDLGFGWEEIGIILVIMLIPFPLIQYPLGKLADSKYGEKEIMTIGFMIMAVSTMALSIFTTKSVLLWSVLLFITRVGAASAEIMIEVYFFKKVAVKETPVLGMFRITRPLSNFVAPLIMLAGIFFVGTTQYMFLIIGAICLIAIYPALTLRDTK